LDVFLDLLFLAEAPDKSGQRHHAVLDRDSHVGGINVRI